jgi:hypothetical protein
LAEFLMVYHGGPMPETDDEMAHEMVRWGDWMNSLGGQLIGPGAPVVKSKTLSASGITYDGGAYPVSGYSIVEAESIEAALAMIKSYPHLDSGTI